MSVIYQAINKINGNSYIGISSMGLERRKHRHKSDALKLNKKWPFHSAIRKYGWDAFDWIILETASNREEALKREIELIAKLRPTYNATKGGDGALGYKHSKKFVKWLREHGNFQKQKKGIVCLNDGKFFSSVKDAASFYQLEHAWISRICTGAYLSARGLYFRHSERPLTKNEIMCEIEKSEARRLKWNEAKKKTQFTSKRVVCINTGKIYKSATEAAKDTGVCLCSISAICTGRYRSSRNKMRFSYQEVA